jgi:hypothetical protein
MCVLFFLSTKQKSKTYATVYPQYMPFETYLLSIFAMVWYIQGKNREKFIDVYVYDHVLEKNNEAKKPGT